MKEYYLGEPVNIHIQSSINIIQEKNWVVTTKKGYFTVDIICVGKFSKADKDTFKSVYREDMTYYYPRIS